MSSLGHRGVHFKILPDHEYPDRFAYRPALDGLRGVAVLAVLLYHLGYPWAGGGFVGVDVFFILSGYLITSLLLIEWERTGRIDLAAFWLRRARRLLPALLVLLFAVTVWVVWAAPPFEWPMRRLDILWSLFYGANWHLIASGQDYFSQFASASPLRHTWSLAIEEQFYLVWPLMVLAAAALARKHRRAVMAISAVGIAGSALAQALLFDPGDPSRAYYGTDSRIFQPLAGALLATVASRQPPRWLAGLRLTIGVLGAAGLGAAIFFLSDRNPAYYLGLSLLLTACGAAVIWAVDGAPSGILARALSLRPLLWVGQISYGLYLWHWPVILAIAAAFGPLRFLPGSTGVNLTRILVTFAISIASFFLIEEPLRRARAPWVGRSAPRFVAVSTAAVVVVAVTAVWLTRATAATPEVAEVNELAEVLTACPDAMKAPCLRYRGDPGSPVVAVVGDSIAMSLDPAFIDLAQKHGWTYVLAAAFGCRISDLRTVYDGQVRPQDSDCHEATPGRLQRLLTDWDPKVIVALDRWEILDAMGPDGKVAATGTPEHLVMTEASLTRAARYLTSGGARLAFVELPPVVLPVCGSAAGRSRPECRQRVEDDRLHAPFNALFRRVASQVPGATTMSITAALCPSGVCRWDLNGMVFRYDGLHFTKRASQWLAPAIYEQMTQAGVSPRSK